MNQAEPRYAVKKPRSLFWKTGLSRSTLNDLVEEGLVGDDWLVCEHGDTSTAVPLSRLDELYPEWEWDEANHEAPNGDVESSELESEARDSAGPRYSVKKPRGLFWKTGLTREGVEKLLEDQVIGDHWLVCEHGVPESAVPVSGIDELHEKLMADWSASPRTVDWPGYEDTNVWKVGFKVIGWILLGPYILGWVLFILYAAFH